MGVIIINAILMGVVFWVAQDGINGDPFKWVLMVIALILIALVNWAEGREYI